MIDENTLDLNFEEGITLLKLIKIVNKNISLITCILSFFIIYINIVSIFYQLGEASYLEIPYKIILNESLSFYSVLFFPLIVGMYILISQLLIFISIKNKMLLCNKYNTVLTNIECIVISLILIISIVLCFFLDKRFFLYIPAISIVILFIFVIILALVNILKRKVKYRRIYILFMRKIKLKYNKKKFFQIKLIYKYNFISVFIVIMLLLSLTTINDMNTISFIVGIMMSIFIVFMYSLVIGSLFSYISVPIYFTIKKNNNIKNILYSKINSSKIIGFFLSLGLVLLCFNMLGRSTVLSSHNFYKITIDSSFVNEEKIFDEKQIVLYETTKRYIIVNYEEKEKETIIYNKKLKYISKSENVSVEKIELKNIKLESRMD